MRQTQQSLADVQRTLTAKRLELTILNKISRTFWTALDIRVLSDHIFGLIFQRIQCSTYAMFVLHDGEPRLILSSHSDLPSSTVDIICQRMAAEFTQHTSQVLVVEKIDVSRSSNAEIMNKTEMDVETVKHIHILPLNILDSTFGLVGLVFPYDHVMSDDDAVFFNIVVNEIALFAENEHHRQVLVNERNRLASILNSMTSAVLVVDEQQKIILSNPMAAAFLGIQNDKAIGKPIHDVVTHTEIRLLFNFLAQHPSEYLTREIEIVNPDGNTMTVKANLAKVRNYMGKAMGIVMVLNDISREKDLDKVRTEFISITSHELRTPLAAIKEAVSLIIDGVTGPVNDKQHKFLDMARRNIDRLTAIINDLLDLSKIASGKVVLQRVDTNINHLLEEVAATFDPVATEGNIRITLALDSKLPQVKVDRAKITQVLSNLVSNALKFTPKGGQVTLGSMYKSKDITLWVRDSGIGIAKNNFDKLFKKFQQIENTLTRSVGGTGLGLAISKEIIEMHGGRIWVESEMGKGSTFYFSLPRQVSVATEGQKCILLIDDEEDFVESLKLRLEQNHYEVVFSNCGVDGLAKARALRPDLIVLDLHLPDIDGFEVCKRLKDEIQTSLIPIVVLTALEQESATWRALSLGVESFFVKPLDPVALLKTIQHLIK